MWYILEKEKIFKKIYFNNFEQIKYRQKIQVFNKPTRIFIKKYRLKIQIFNRPTLIFIKKYRLKIQVFNRPTPIFIKTYRLKIQIFNRPTLIFIKKYRLKIHWYWFIAYCMRVGLVSYESKLLSFNTRSNVFLQSVSIFNWIVTQSAISN